MKAPFRCCQHANHKRALVDGVTHCVCRDCHHCWWEWPLAE